jgi:uncharacterized protein (TIGR03437 family)
MNVANLSFSFGSTTEPSRAKLLPIATCLRHASRAGSPLLLQPILSEVTSVSFNGTAAAFTVISDSEITTTVPAGATTGRVKVTTHNHILTSNLVFQITE